MGQRDTPTHEDILIPLLAVVYELPVKWVETRTESFKAVPHARQQIHHIRVGTDRDGKILAVKDRIVVDFGAYVNRTGPIEALNSTAFIPGCYKFDNYAFELFGVLTNKTPLVR